MKLIGPGQAHDRRITANGQYTRVEGLAVDGFSRAAMDKALAELQEERAGVAHLFG